MQYIILLLIGFTGGYLSSVYRDNVRRRRLRAGFQRLTIGGNRDQTIYIASTTKADVDRVVWLDDKDDK